MIKKTVLEYFKHHKLRSVLIAVAIVFVAIIALMPAQLLKIIVDDIIPEKNAQRLLTVSVIYALTYVALGIATFIKDIIMLKTGQDITACLKLNMMKHFEKMSYKAISNSDSGTMEAYFNNDVNTLNELFTSGVVNMATDLFKMIGIVISVFIFSVTFGFILLAILPLLVLFTSYIRKRMLNAQLKTKSLEGNVNKDLLENVENIEQIKVNKSENYSINKYNNILIKHFKANQTSIFYSAFFPPVMQIIKNTAVCVVLLVSGFNANIFGLSVGAIIAVISLLTDLFVPVESLGMEIQTIQKSIAGVKRISSFFLTEENTDNQYKELSNYNISFKNVSFAYEDKTVVQNFNLEIKEGAKIALQGPSGAGKSTLLKLALGLIKPSDGSVTIGGVDNFSLDDRMRKQLFAIIYQDPFFSGGSIYEEISLKDETITKEKVLEALKEVGLDYITDVNAILNEKKYSSGELALFNVARIMVRNSKVIFLDEMNAKIDPITGKKIIELINTIAVNKTVISINHYGDVLENAKIVKLNFGA